MCRNVLFELLWNDHPLETHSRRDNRKKTFFLYPSQEFLSKFFSHLHISNIVLNYAFLNFYLVRTFEVDIKEQNVFKSKILRIQKGRSWTKLDGHLHQSGQSGTTPSVFWTVHFHPLIFIHPVSFIRAVQFFISDRPLCYMIVYFQSFGPSS